MFSHTVNIIMNNNQYSFKIFCDCLTLIFRAISLYYVHTLENVGSNRFHP